MTQYMKVYQGILHFVSHGLTVHPWI